MRGRYLVFMFLVLMLAGAALVTGNAMGQEADAASPSPADGQSLWSKSNLVAWCIVPFDSEKRQPQERAAMLRKLGLKRIAYDYRAEHVPQFEEEILALQAEGIELTAWWFPTVLNDEARLVLSLLKKHQQTPQLWVMGSGEPADGSPEALEVHLQRETERIQLIADAAGEIGCRVAL